MVTISLGFKITSQTGGYFDPVQKKSFVASGDITVVHTYIKSFVPGAFVARKKKKKESKTNQSKGSGCSNPHTPVPHSLLFFCLRSSQSLHFKYRKIWFISLSGKHCSRKQSKSIYLASLKLQLFSLANLCNSHGEAGKEFDEAYNDD